ncbi:MAG: O-antigen ligase family protein [Cellvibrio sp.]|uniref:O-antigen ligase family protein n=1 Tax=Cellvibrio sp. TaxID=1965322 RepID=UPI0031AA2A27
MKKKFNTEEFYAFKVKYMWDFFRSQHFSFWMICGYLFVEFVKPQLIFGWIDFLPWAQLLLMGALAGAFTDATIKWVASSANILIILFLITILLSVLNAIYPEVARMQFMLFFSWVIIYFLTINIINSWERFYIFLMIYIVAAGKIAVGSSKNWAGRGFSFEGWGLMGPPGHFQNSGELAVLMVMLFPLAFYLYQSLKSKIALWERIILIIFWMCPILVVVGASSRGSQVALAVVMLLMFRKSIFRLKQLIGVLALVSVIFYMLPDQQKERFLQAGDDKTSQQRLLYWEHGWEMMKDHPLSGVGFFNFIPYYEAHYSYDMLYPTAQLPHNIFIQVGTDAGFIALFFFILLIFYCLFVPIRISKSYRYSDIQKAVAIGLGYGVLGFLIAGQFVTISYYPFLWIHLAMIVALSSFGKTKRYNNGPSDA